MSRHQETLKKTDILLQLGAPDLTNNDWPDYRQYGFNESDIPDLIKLLTDPSLHTLEAIDKEEDYAQIHAWRTLGQLGHADAIQPLIAATEFIMDDDWALSELPEVFGLLGSPAIQPLFKHINSTGHESSRIMAVEGLREIAKRQPASRDKVLTCFNALMVKAASHTRSFNGILIANLMDIGATELIDSIRDLYERELVNISIPGDLEDVEIELGLRKKRSTPRPDYSDDLFDEEDEDLFPEDFFPEDLDPDFSIEDFALNMFDSIERYLQLYGSEYSIRSASGLDGFVTALACCPHSIPPSVWLPAIWGTDKDRSPEWQDEEQFSEFSAAVFTFYNLVMENMNAGTHEHLYYTDIRNGQTINMVDDWCHGFLLGGVCWGQLLPQQMRNLEKAIKPMMLFATDEGIEHQQHPSNKELARKQKAIEPAVLELFHHFQKDRDSNTPNSNNPIKTGFKIGRNDPCPCGSGRKFKKCCLIN